MPETTLDRDQLLEACEAFQAQLQRFHRDLDAEIRGIEERQRDRLERPLADEADGQ